MEYSILHATVLSFSHLSFSFSVVMNKVLVLFVSNSGWCYEKYSVIQQNMFSFANID